MSLSLLYKGKRLNIIINRTGAEKLTVNAKEVAKSIPSENRYNGFYSVSDNMLDKSENVIIIDV